jgi:hypothetical protein
VDGKRGHVTGDLNLVRTVPDVEWLGPSDRTVIDFSTSYSWNRNTFVTNQAKVKTFLYQADAERDQYLNPRLFAFAQMVYNHNISQNLELQQTYQGGLGFVLLKKARSEFDFKASLGYIKRAYYISSFNRSLIGSTFAEDYQYKWKHAQFHEEIPPIPAWNIPKAWAAAGNAGLTLPFSDRFSVDIDSLDAFLYGAPTGYRKNSFQLSLGLSYDLP